MEFNHNEAKLKDALNVSEKDLEDCKEKVTQIIKSCFLEENFKPSHAVEKIVHTFSYNELIFIASVYILEKVNYFEKELENASDNIISSIIKKLKEDND
jgi:predicted nucleic-acid-binding protein